MKRSNIFLFGSLFLSMMIIPIIGFSVITSPRFDALVEKNKANKGATPKPGSEWTLVGKNGIIEEMKRDSGLTILQCNDSFRIYGRTDLGNYEDNGFRIMDIDCLGEKTISWKFRIARCDKEGTIFLRYHYNAIFFVYVWGELASPETGEFRVFANAEHGKPRYPVSTPRCKVVKGRASKSGIERDENEYQEMKIIISADRRYVTYFVNGSFLAKLEYDASLRSCSEVQLGLQIKNKYSFNDVYFKDIKVSCN